MVAGACAACASESRSSSSRSSSSGWSLACHSTGGSRPGLERLDGLADVRDRHEPGDPRPVRDEDPAVAVAEDRHLVALVVRLGAERRDRHEELELALPDRAAGLLWEPAESLERLLAAHVEPLTGDVEPGRSAPAHGCRLLAGHHQDVDVLRRRRRRGSEQGQSYDGGDLHQGADCR